ncbi:MAG TPA: prepilin-type cleavage/methylation domain-containing protein [Betaproteobacteria bacterium]|nr:prepilin-type cleavage/methylation domain-containing protein [Betaproteobacteria bacterium]
MKATHSLAAPRRSSGFTLVEMAIVLVIIGLLLGGILKGQELIDSARVRNVADQINGMQAAFYAFQDRYRALPGDYSLATTNISTTQTGNGNGNGTIAAGESALAFSQLTAAGFINCSVCTATATAASTAANSPANTFGGAMQIVTNNTYAGTATARNNIKSGNHIPSNVMGEVDQKIDDANPNTGSVRFSAWNGGGGGPNAGTCTNAGANPVTWQRATVDANCGAANLL